MAQIYTYKDATLPAVELAGGKGLALLYSKKKGFNVPTTVVLSTEFFQLWLEQLKRTPEWKVFTQTEDDSLTTAATAVKNSCQGLTFDAEQQKTLAEVRHYLRAEGIKLMAVRSSSPEEDLEGASFAGIYETVLGVNAANLEDAIKICFASALDERVVADKQQSKNLTQKRCKPFLLRR
jgi:pyruvate,water dikinase